MKAYGAEAYPGIEPIGGGLNYPGLLSSNECDVGAKTLAEFKSYTGMTGKRIWLGAGIDLSAYEKFSMAGGITLATTPGLGSIYNNDKARRYVPLLLPGANTRFIGLKVLGPDQSVGSDGQMPMMHGIEINYPGCIVEACEITGFPYAGVVNYAVGTRVIFPYIHHCTRQGVGYGVSNGVGCTTLIMGAYINACRHAIMGERGEETGIAVVPPSYEICYCEFGPDFINSVLDCHGGNDTNEPGWDWGTLPKASPPYTPTIWAGDTILIHHNTNRCTNQIFFGARGIPRSKIEVTKNWLYSSARQESQCLQIVNRIEAAGGTIDGKRIVDGQYYRMVVEDNWSGLAAPPDIDGSTPPPPPPPPPPTPPTPPGEANIVLSNLSISPNPAPMSTKITVSVIAKNTGTAAGSRVLSLSGWWEGSQTVTLAAGESMVMSFTFTPSPAATPGDYIIGVNELSGTLVIASAPTPPVTPPTPGPASFSYSNLTINPARVQRLHQCNVGVTMANTGGAAGSLTVKMSGWWRGSKTISLAAGASTVVTFTFTPSRRCALGPAPVIVGPLSGTVTVTR
jgi:hypothetical protein